jgi:hypothetical protein
MQYPRPTLKLQIGFQEPLPLQELPQQQQPSIPYSPPSKRSHVDKWAVLGERRRAYTGHSSSKAPEVTFKTGRSIGHGFDSSPLGIGHGNGVFDIYGHHNSHTFNLHTNTNNHGSNHSMNLNNHGKWSSPVSKDRTKDCPWTHNKSRERDWHYNLNWRKEKRNALGDNEWVGGWQQEIHAMGGAGFI